MEFTADEIARLLGGIVEGDPKATVDRFSRIEEGEAGALSFLSNPKYFPFIYSTQSSIVLVGKDFTIEKPVKPTLVKVDDAYLGMARLLELYSQSKKKKSGIDPAAHIDPSAKTGEGTFVGPTACIGKNCRIGKNVQIHAGVILGDNIKIGDDTVIYAGVRIYDDCSIGQRCTIHSGVVIGGDGFGFAPNDQNHYSKVPQIGNVVLEDGVEVGANTTIDRATMGSTVIRKGAKLDNLIQIAHNVDIGENTVIAAQTGIAGSTKIGRNCMIGGQVGIVGHITIADGVKIAAQSGVGSDIKEEGAIVQGSPAFGIGDYKKSYVLFRKLPALQQEIETLRSLIHELKQATE